MSRNEGVLTEAEELRLAEEARVEVIDTKGRIDRDAQSKVLADKLADSIARQQLTRSVAGMYAVDRARALVNRQRRQHKLNLAVEGKFRLLDPYAVATVERRVDVLCSHMRAADVIAWVGIETRNAAAVAVKHAAVLTFADRLLAVLGTSRVDDVEDEIREKLGDLLYDGGDESVDDEDESD